uniref:Uncharacterized protein n=1 Tax=Haptolina brevifila TaxID=156173 RepID=A0A7S2C3D0_9EUKA
MGQQMGLVAVSHRSPLLVAVLLGAATVLTLRSVAPEFHVDLGPMHFDIGEGDIDAVTEAVEEIKEAVEADEVVPTRVATTAEEVEAEEEANEAVEEIAQAVATSVDEPLLEEGVQELVEALPVILEEGAQGKATVIQDLIDVEEVLETPPAA